MVFSRVPFKIGIFDWASKLKFNLGHLWIIVKKFFFICLTDSSKCLKKLYRRICVLFSALLIDLELLSWATREPKLGQLRGAERDPLSTYLWRGPLQVHWCLPWSSKTQGRELQCRHVTCAPFGLHRRREVWPKGAQSWVHRCSRCHNWSCKVCLRGPPGLGSQGYQSRRLSCCLLIRAS